MGNRRTVSSLSSVPSPQNVYTMPAKRPLPCPWNIPALSADQRMIYTAYPYSSLSLLQNVRAYLRKMEVQQLSSSQSYSQQRPVIPKSQRGVPTIHRITFARKWHQAWRHYKSAYSSRGFLRPFVRCCQMFVRCLQVLPG